MPPIRSPATTATTTSRPTAPAISLRPDRQRLLGVSGNNNFLDGAQGDDVVAASGNGNTLDGGADNDQLVAGGAHTGDRFVFHPGYGMDSATGFLRHGAGGTDVIDVNGFGLNFTTLQPFMADVGGNCVITLDAATVLTVIGVTQGAIPGERLYFLMYRPH